MQMIRSTSAHRARSTMRIRHQHKGPLGWLRDGQLGAADIHDIWSHPAGQWRF